MCRPTRRRASRTLASSSRAARPAACAATKSGCACICENCCPIRLTGRGCSGRTSSRTHYRLVIVGPTAGCHRPQDSGRPPRRDQSVRRLRAASSREQLSQRCASAGLVAVTELARFLAGYFARLFSGDCAASAGCRRLSHGARHALEDRTARGPCDSTADAVATWCRRARHAPPRSRDCQLLEDVRVPLETAGRLSRAGSTISATRTLVRSQAGPASS